MSFATSIRIPASLGLLLFATVALAQPLPGDVYREYTWRPTADPTGTSTANWLRVTGPDATNPGASDFLPNLVNHLNIDDFDHAIRAEMTIEMNQVHPGTIGHAVRFNGGSWLSIPTSSPYIPGTSGLGLPALEYHMHRPVVVPVSLGALASGDNSFEFTAANGTSFASQWPQWLVYGAAVRVYYDSAAKAHPTGQITSPLPNATIGENAVFQAAASSAVPIEQVDFVGRYTDFNWKGDGNYRQWQDRTLYSELKNHIGTDTQAPYSVAWQNDWVPDQEQPMDVSARIVDSSGLTYITPAVTGLNLQRDYSVEMIKPYDVPRKWSTRVGNTHTAKLDVTSDMSDATEARFTMSTWNGVASDEIALNDQFVITRVGKNHDQSYDSFNVPLGLIQQGTNVFSTFSNTVHHGIDVQWPGPVLMVRHDQLPPPEGPHVSEGLIAAYDFREGSGNTVHDVSGVGSPLDLTIQNAGNVSWGADFLSVDTSTVIASSGAATKIISEVVDANEISVEAWVKPLNDTLAGAARIVNIGTTVVDDAPFNRNFFLGQDNANIDARLRTTTTGDNGASPEQTTDSSGAVVTNPTELLHLMFTRDTSGNSFIYVDGIKKSNVTVTQGGDLSAWDPSFFLTLANELVYTNVAERDFLGEYHLVSFYDRALSTAEVRQNFAAGPTLASGLEGDFDDDGDVDGDDLLMWQLGGAPGGTTPGNLALWQDNFGASNSSLAANLAVPEPSTGVLIGLAFAGLIGYRRSLKFERKPLTSTKRD